MNETSSRKGLAGAALLALAFLVVFFLGLRSIGAPETWFHLAAGSRVMEQGVAYQDAFSFALPEGTTWRQTSWLYDWLLALLWHGGGAPLVILLHALAATGAFILLTASIKQEASAGQRAAAVLLCAWILAPVYTVGPRLISLLLIALFMQRLQAGRPGALTIGLLAILQIIWTNMHVSFVLGPLLALLTTIDAWLQQRKKGGGFATIRSSALLLAALLATTLLNPFGIRVWTESIGLLLNPASAIRLEWISPFAGDFLPLRLDIFIWAALALIAVTFVLRRQKLPFLPTCAAVISAFIMIRSTAALDYGAIFCLPFVALGINTLGEAARKQLPVIEKPAFGALGIITLFIFFSIVTNRYYVYSGSAASFGLQANLDLTPATLLDAAEDLNIALPRVINVAQDGGYLLLTRPEHNVYSDPRGRIYGSDFFAGLYRMLTGQTRDEGETPPEPGEDAILLNATWNGARAALINFIAREDWGIAFFDGSSILLLRNTEANRPILENTAFSRAGLVAVQQEYNRYRKALENKVMRPSNPARLIGASSIYQVLGRYEESLAILKLLTEGSPRNVTALVNRGIAELSLGQAGEAAGHLAEAVTLTPGNALAWLWLDRAYRATGNDQAAAEAEARGRALNPELADRFAADVKSAPRPAKK